MKEKLTALNSLDVTDYSSDGFEMEYVLVENTEENVKVLMDTGFTREEIESATDESDTDLCILAFQYADANWWSPKEGFAKRNREVSHAG